MRSPPPPPPPDCERANQKPRTAKPINNREQQMLQRDWALLRGKAVLKIAYSRKKYFKARDRRCRLLAYEINSGIIFIYLFSGTCGRQVKFTTEKEGYALQGHVIKNLSLELGTRDPCRGQCVMESRCVSINIGPPINDRVICELSDSDHSLHPEDLKPRAGFTYTGTKVKY